MFFGWVLKNFRDWRDFSQEKWLKNVKISNFLGIFIQICWAHCFCKNLSVVPRLFRLFSAPLVPKLLGNYRRRKSAILYQGTGAGYSLYPETGSDCLIPFSPPPLLANSTAPGLFCFTFIKKFSEIRLFIYP